MISVEDLTTEYMKLLEGQASSFTEENKRDMLDSASVILALYLGRTKSSGYSFRFPKSADIVFDELRKKLYANFEKYSNNGIKLSQLKNQKIFGKTIEVPVISGFLQRKVGDFTLKQRIAKYTQMFRMELEARVAMAIVNGEKQDLVIKSISRYLDRPYDILDPKIRKIWLSNRLARKYNSGSGTYKSAYANFKRLGYSEIIESFRRADHKIWSSLKEVVGQLIYLNPAHPIYDSCDELVGIYPATFLFTGFHSRCICLNMPITRGKTITKIPSSAKDYMSQEKPKKWWGSLPFVVENLKYWK